MTRCPFLPPLALRAGFAMVETGFARLTNAQNVLMKNAIDLSACAIAYWVTGYALSFGGGRLGNSFCGFSKFFLIDADDYDWLIWFFNFTFLANSAAIFGGSIAGRSKFIACVTLNAFHSGFTYPIVAHWVRVRGGKGGGAGGYGGPSILASRGCLCAESLRMTLWRGPLSIC